MARSAKYDALRDAMFMAAALRKTFRPRDLMAEVVPADERSNILLRGHLTSALREQCTTQGDYWQLRPIARRKILEQTPASDSLPENEIASALKGESIYTDAALSEMIEAEAPSKMLALAVATLEQAGPSAPGHTKLMALSSKLDHARGEAATDALLADGFVGRADELNALMQALDQPNRNAPLRNLHIQGLPGVGKTYLLEQLSRQSRDRPRIVLVRLDFDRSSLAMGAVDALFDEISRQIGAAMPWAAARLNSLRLQSAQRRTRIAKGAQDAVPYDLLHGMIDILAQGDRQLVFLLDTLEVLHGHGATFVHRLMEQIDRFADKERLDITVISAGRGAIFASDDKRLLQLMRLEKLDREVTQAILHKRGVPVDLHDQIIELAAGNPLRLVLVTRALEAQGEAEALGVDEVREADNGYLYRAILSRVPVDIREVAAEGLVMPVITLEVLMHVIGPALSIEMDLSRATRMRDLLEQQRWMVERHSDGSVTQIAHVRREMLELTYAERPVQTRRINEAAVTYYQTRDPLRALYHRLQLSRDTGTMPDIAPPLARQLTEAMLADLPPPAQDAVLRAQGARSRVERPAPSAPASSPAFFKGAAVKQMKAQAVPRDVLCIVAQPGTSGGRLQLVKGDAQSGMADAGGLADLRNMLEIAERREATHLLNTVFAVPVCFEGEAALLALTHQWQTGHWSMAQALLDLLPDEALLRAMEDDLHLTGLALLEIWAEFRFDALCTRLQDQRFWALARDALGLTQRLGLYGGALAIALMVAQRGLNPEVDNGINILGRYLSQGIEPLDRDTVERSVALRGEFGLGFEGYTLGLSSINYANHALLSAPLNPYLAALRALLEDTAVASPRKVHRDIGALCTRLTRLSDVYVPHVTGVAEAQARVRPEASDVSELMGAIGLTAELAGGYSYYSPIPDLPTIARAAERWQNATLGRWTYGAARPETWIENTIDPLALSRTQAILSQSDAKDTALFLLTLWDDPATRNSTSVILPKKLRAPYELATQERFVENAIEALQATKVPSALWPPLVALAQSGISAKEIF